MKTEAESFLAAWQPDYLRIINTVAPMGLCKHPAQPADRVTDNRDQFRKRWRRTSEATNFTEALS